MREAPPLRLKRSPLAFVLCQIRFPAFLNMEQCIPSIQSDLRGLGYTRFSQENAQQVDFVGGGIKTGLNTRWVFPNRMRNEAVVLAPSFLVYETSDYDVFETFVARVLPLVDVVRDATDIDFAEQVGLRYVDVIRSGGGREATGFLNNGLHGLSSDGLGANVMGRQFLTQAQTDSGELYVRCFANSGEDFMPPDLATTHLEFKLDTALLADETYEVLDIDHIAKREIPLAKASVGDTLWTLHHGSNKAFLAAVTEEAVRFWKGED